MPVPGMTYIASTYNSLARTGGVALSDHGVQMWYRRYSFICTTHSQLEVFPDCQQPEKYTGIENCIPFLSCEILSILHNLPQPQSLYLLHRGNDYTFGRELL